MRYDEEAFSVFYPVHDLCKPSILFHVALQKQ